MVDLANLTDIAANLCELEVLMQFEANHPSAPQQEWKQAIAHLRFAEAIVLHLLTAKSQDTSNSTAQQPNLQLLKGGLSRELQKN